MEAQPRVADVNTMPVAELVDLLGRCVAVPRWAREVADGRPYAGLTELLGRADEVSAGLTDDEVRAALRDHPRIGERPVAGSRTATLSTAEQSSMDRSGLADSLAAANAAYEARFGHIYLVCAAGRDGEDLLSDLADRMTNDPAAELLVVRAELGLIARLRLAGLVTG